MEILGFNLLLGFKKLYYVYEMFYFYLRIKLKFFKSLAPPPLPQEKILTPAMMKYYYLIIFLFC